MSVATANAELVRRLAGQAVLVAGDLMLDEFIWGRVSRISPEAPVPVVEVDRRTYAAGGAANTAANIAALGGRAIVAGMVGTDMPADRVMEAMRLAAIDASAVVRQAGVPTTVKTRVVAHSQQVVRIDQEASGEMPDAAAMLAALDRPMGLVKAVVVSDYGKGVVSSGFATGLISKAKSAKVPVIVDPKGTDYSKYRGATLVKPNQAEAGKVLNRDLKSTEDVDRAGSDLIALLGGSSHVLITRGAHGMALYRAGEQPRHLPAFAREVYDVTGAGDTVAGTLALAIAAGIDWPVACELASRAAAVVVQKLGTATLTPAELEHHLNAGRESP